MLEFLTTVEPTTVTADLDALLLIERLTTVGWIDTATAAPVLLRAEIETEAARDHPASRRTGR